MTCADCDHWRATYMEVYAPGAQPHHARALAAETEMLRATHALCTWEPPAMDAPLWAWVSLSAGALTHERDGVGCPAFVQRAAEWAPVEEPRP